MEALVGRAVRKAFPGFGTYAGVVESYDADAGYFRVLYEDGDSEEVDADEMAGILVGPAMPPALQQTPPRDVSSPRRPKKRRRGDGESPTPAPHASPGDGVVLAVPAADGGSDGETEPATPAEESTEPAVAEKKRRLSPGPVSSARPVRRSARQAKAAERAAEMEAAAAVAAAAEAAEAEAAAASTPQQSGRKRPRANGSGRYRSVSRDLEEAAVKKTPPKPVLPPKPELPPSSQGLDLGGLPVLDVFQVYSCLRSFSRQLFLSPFPLDTFVAALHSTFVNPLIDCVHFALLRALKSHLEDFANEGDPSAVHCIRNLNWELLDLATWPIYLAEYLLTRGTELRYGMKLTDLKLLSTEYYRQPAVVKLELLRSLSDDVLEIGAIRSRMSEADGNDEGFRRTGLRRKKRGSYAKGAVDSSQSPEGSDEMDDGRLNGLLTGPWQNPQYHIYWRKAVLKASDVSSLKQPLLMLESSLRRVAISGEWQKPADAVEVVGSAAHILVRSSNKSSSHGTARKPGRKPSSNGELKVDSRDVGVYWWRGGKLSRQVFHWKRLPQSLVYKAARQAGRRKIPTILYTDGSQFARRFKYIAWQAAVEMAENVAQLILQIKELEWNIKWTEILGTLPSSLMTKEMQKIARLFKKVIIRRKRIEGTNVEYLLDFGKRENIPPVISKHGKKFEEPSSERNREAVNCQYCADWFHGDIYSVTIENVNNLIGFKCHRCLMRSLPVCPYAQTKSDKDHGIKSVPDEVHKIDKFVVDEDHNCQKDVGARGSQKDLHDHSSLKKVDIESRLNGHITEKELSDNNCLEELDDHNNLKEVGTRSTEEELDENKSLKELDAHNELKELDSPGSEKELVNDYCPKELDNPINLKDLDSCRADRELKNHNYLNELDGRYYWKGLNGHNSQEELYGTPSSKFAAEGRQCPTELNGFNGLKIDNHDNLEELNSHNCPVEIDNKNSSKEPDNNRSPHDSCDFLAEHFNNIRISGKEALIVTPETGPVKESPALQSKDDSEKTVPAEHDIDFQVVVT
nr:unnamed protein product [Digitaria exilis]